jgi:hypothetical protein
MTFRAFLVVFVSVCLTALVMLGCGAGSGGPATSSAATRALSKTQYIAQADAICRRANKRQEVLLARLLESRKPNAKVSNSDRIAFVLKAGLPPLRQEASQLAKLDVSARQMRKAAALVHAIRKAIVEIEAAPLAFAEGKSTAFLPVARRAKELQLRVCGQP